MPIYFVNYATLIFLLAPFPVGLDESWPVGYKTRL